METRFKNEPVYKLIEELEWIFHFKISAKQVVMM